MIITHCDLEMPDEEIIEGKRQAFQKYGGILIPQEHVVRFDNT